MQTSWEATSPAGPWTSASFYFDRHGVITLLRPAIFIFALRPRHRAEECMACAAIMRPGWHYRGWGRVKKANYNKGTFSIHSRAPTVGHSTPRIEPSAWRSIVGA